MWPDYARNSLLKAVYGAFNKVNIPTRRNVHIISEPAACALYVIQDVIRNSSRSLQVVSSTKENLNLTHGSRETVSLYVMLVAVQLSVAQPSLNSLRHQTFANLEPIFSDSNWWSRR